VTDSEATLPVQMPDFDELAELASTDPEQFEVLRAQLLEQCVQCAPPSMHRRLRGLVFELDAARQTAASRRALRQSIGDQRSVSCAVEFARRS